jgi:hypothetical protein
VAERGLATPPAETAQPRRKTVPAWVWTPTVIGIVNAILFLIVRPGVNDLWAARARASAARHGVGLTYWFSWFGGGTTPGNYSVLSPYLSAYLTAEVVGAASAVALTLLVAALVRGTSHPAAATAVATLAAGVNLWSGRVPFLLGTAFAVWALIAVRQRRPAWAVLATVLTILSSPVSAAFLALGLTGPLIVSRAHRRVSAVAIGTIVLGLGLVALAFGAPGPQHFSWYLCLQTVVGLLVFLIARPPAVLATVIWLSILCAFGMMLVPNGMGSNFVRMTWFCLPVAVVALSKWRALPIALLAIVPVFYSGISLTVSDLRQAGQVTANPSYYKPLAAELDRIPDLAGYRLEVVAEKAHAAYDALLNHAMLARGWETQEDNHLNATLRDDKLGATAYKIWLDNNSVGYVAIPRSKIETFPEYTLVASGKLGYLSEIWHDDDWSLYRVRDAVPIVAAPQHILEYSQSHLTLHTACACSFTVRIRFSKYLHASPADRTTMPADARATVADDGFGFTRVTTTEPGTYVLRGSVKLIFR